MQKEDEGFENECVAQPNLDHRWQVKENLMKHHPYTCIGTVKMFDGCLGEQRKQTAFLISSNLVLTTASFVWPAHAFEEDDYKLGEPSSIEFTLESSKSSYRVTSYKLPDKYIKILINKDRNWKQSLAKVDFLLCKLERQITLNKYIKLSDGTQQLGREYFIGGYPHDHVGLFIHKGSMTLKENGILNYQVDTSKGQEGSPILFMKGIEEYAIGMHVGDDLTKTAPNNFGLYFDESVLNQLKMFQKEMKANQFMIYGQKITVESRFSPPQISFQNVSSPRHHANSKALHFLSPTNKDKSKNAGNGIRSRSKSRSNKLNQ